MRRPEFKGNKRLAWCLLFVAIGAAGVYLAQLKKDALVREAAAFLQKMLLRETELDFRIGRMRGKLSGGIRFEDVRIEDPALPEGDRMLFSAKEIRFRYNFLDFISKQFGSKLEVTVVEPVIVWRPSARLSREPLPILSWMKQWALSSKGRFSIRLLKTKFYMGSVPLKIEEFFLDAGPDSFRAEIPIRHLEIAGSDISSVIKVSGRIEPGLIHEDDALVGEIRTEGSVVNWNPLPAESAFDFRCSRRGLHISASDFLGGIEVTGAVDFQNGGEAEWTLHAEDYALSNLDAFLQSAQKISISGRMSLDLGFSGDLFAPQVNGDVRVESPWLGKELKAMDIHVDGVYPTVRLTGSRVLLQDGSSMRLADETLEAQDLFNEKTYQALVSGAQQDNVVWGDWEFRHPRDENDKPEFLIQRSFGDRARLHFRKFNVEDEDLIESRQTQPMELGLELKLRPKDSVKLEWREEEGFVGVERKMKF